MARILDGTLEHVLVFAGSPFSHRDGALRGRNLPAMGYLRRQLVTAALTANAIRPAPRQRTPRSPPSSPAGWPASWPRSCWRRAPLDTAAELTVRRRKAGHPDRAGLLLAGAATAGLGYLIVNATRSATHVETTLRDGLGVDYLDELEEPPDAEDLKTPLREIARPFKLTKPDVEVIRDINYTEGGKRARLDIYRPKGVDLENAPVLVQVHGGGWTIGNKEQQGLLLMKRMAERGWVCVAMNYRLAPKHPFPAQIVDVKKAIAWTARTSRRTAATRRTSSSPVAPPAVTSPRWPRSRRTTPEYQPGFEDADTSVAGCVPFYGVYDLAGAHRRPGGGRPARLLPRPAGLQEGPGTTTSTTSWRPRPSRTSPPTPPTSSCCTAPTTRWSHVDQARAFVDALKAESKATVTYAEFPGTQHAFEVFALDPQPPRHQGGRALAAAPPHPVGRRRARAGRS